LTPDFETRVTAVTETFSSEAFFQQAVPRLARDPSSTFATLFDIRGQVYYHSPASHLTFTTLAVLLQRIGDKNVLPFVHVSLAFLWSLAYVPSQYAYVEGDVPWSRLAGFLNTLGKTDVDEDRVMSRFFPSAKHWWLSLA